MPTPPKPLLCRAPLHPGESLASLLARLAQRNGYQPRSILTQLCLTGISDRRASHPTHSTTFQRLAELTWIDPDQLYNATTHRFANLFIPPDQAMMTLILPGGHTKPLLPPQIAGHHLRPEAAAQFCPDCLRETAYHRLIWQAVAVTTCLRHQCLLRHTCPQCQGTLSIQTIVKDHCPDCQTSLSHSQTISVADDAFGLFAQKVIQSWLMAKNTTAHTDADLPDHSAQILYQLIAGLRISFLPFPSDWSYFHQFSIPVASFPNRRIRFSRITPAQSHILHTTAFKALTHWPDQFQALLHAFRFRDGPSIHRRMIEDFPFLYHQCFHARWQHPAFQFVQDVFNQFLIDHYARTHTLVGTQRYWTLKKKLPYLTILEAAHLLDQPPSTIRTLIARGELTAYPALDQPNADPFVLQEEVLAWYRQHQLISIDKTALLLGLSKQTVFDLIRVGLLKTEGTSRFGSDYICYIRQETISNLRYDLTHYLFQPQRPLLTLATAAKLLAHFSLGEASILQCVVHRHLPCYANTYVVSDLSDLRFTEYELQAIIDKIQCQLDSTLEHLDTDHHFPLLSLLFHGQPDIQI